MVSRREVVGVRGGVGRVQLFGIGGGRTSASGETITHGSVLNVSSKFKIRKNWEKNEKFVCLLSVGTLHNFVPWKEHTR